MEDILFLCADGLTGLPEAAEAAFPQAVFQTCVVHLIRSSTRLVPWKDKKAVCADLKALYTAESIKAAEQALDVFEDKWGAKYPMVHKAWRERWAEWTPFLAYPQEIRRAIYTTNVIEAANRQIRKVLKTKDISRAMRPPSSSSTSFSETTRRAGGRRGAHATKAPSGSSSPSSSRAGSTPPEPLGTVTVVVALAQAACPPRGGDDGEGCPPLDTRA